MKKSNIVKKIFLISIFLLVGISSFSQNLTSVFVNGKWGALNENYEEIVPIEYDGCTIVFDEFAIVKLGYKYGLYDNKGNLLFAAEQKKINVKEHPFLIIYTPDKRILYNVKTKSVFAENNQIFIKKIKNDILAYFHNNQVIIKNNSTGKQTKLDVDSISSIKVSQFATANNSWGNIASTILTDRFYYYLIYKNGKVGVVSQNFEPILDTKYNSITTDYPYFYITNSYNQKGISNFNGAIISSPQFDRIEFDADFDLFYVHIGNKIGVVDVNGKKLIDVNYKSVNYLNECFIVTNDDNKTGLIDKNGRIKIQPKYDYIDQISSDRFITSLDNKIGLIDKNGKIIISPQFSSIKSFDDDVFKYKDSLNLFGLINKNGKIILPPQYTDFSKTTNPNVYLFTSLKKDFISNKEVCRKFNISKDIKRDTSYQYRYGAVTKKGEMLFDSLYYQLQIKTSPKYVIVKKDSLMHLVFSLDNKGNIIEKLELRYFTTVDAGWIPDYYYWDFNSNVRISNWGLLSSKRGVIINYKFDRIYQNLFTDTAVVLTVDDYGYYGFVDDVYGYEIYRPTFDSIKLNDFNVANVARCIMNNRQSILIGRDGREIPNFDVAYVDTFYNSTTRTCHGGTTKKQQNQIYTLNVNGYTEGTGEFYIDGGKWSIIDNNANFIIKKEYDFLQKQFRNEYICVKNGLWGVVSNTGAIKIENQYKELKYFEDEKGLWQNIGYLRAKNNRGKWGAIDTFSNLVVDYNFQDLKYLKTPDGLFWGVKSNNKWGVINSAGDTVIPIVYDGVEYLKNDTVSLFKVVITDNLFGYFNHDFSNNSEAMFLKSKHFVNNYAKVKLKKGWTFVDTNYNIITSDFFIMTNNFSDGMAAVRTRDGWGYIDSSGDMIIEPQYNQVGDFSSGLAQIRVKGKVGFINKQNDIVFKNKYKYTSDFIGDVALVKKRKKYAILNQKTKKQTAFKYKNFKAYPEYNIFVISDKKNRKIILKSDGTIPFDVKKYKSIAEFTEGMAIVTSYDNKYGFIDFNGQEKFNPQYNRVTNFHNGFASIMQDNKWALINKDTTITGFDFKKCYNVNNYGYATVKNKNNELQYIDTLGVIQNDSLVKIICDNIFHDDITIKRVGNKYQYLDLTLNPIDTILYDKALDFIYGKGIVTINRKYGVVSTNGNFIVPPIILNISEYENQHSIYKVNEQYSIFNTKGEEILPTNALNVEFVSNDLIKVQMYHKILLINNKGKIVWE